MKRIRSEGLGLLITLILCNLTGCDSKGAANAAGKPRAGLQWASNDTQVHWRGAYEHCEQLANKDGVAWRLPTAKEVIRQYENNFVAGPSDNYYWTGLFNESVVHFTINLDHGAKQWRGDDKVFAKILCVNGTTWDDEAWLVDFFNAKIMGRFEHAASIAKYEAEQGNAEAENQLGNLYFKGEGVPQNDQLALDLYQKAYAHGFKAAETNIEKMRDLGRAR